MHRERERERERDLSGKDDRRHAALACRRTLLEGMCGSVGINEDDETQLLLLLLLLQWRVQYALKTRTQTVKQKRAWCWRTAGKRDDN